MNKKNLFLLKDMDQDSAHMVAASKVPMLKPGEYEIWRMRIEQYIQMIDYALWEVIENGATLPKTKIVEGVMTEMPITTAKEKAQIRLYVKARSTLMMGYSHDITLKFNSYKDAKKSLEAVEKEILMLDQTFDRLQKLVSQLELLDEKLSQEDVNQKLLRSLSPEWNTHAVVWRNKADLDTMSMDDLYNNLKSSKNQDNKNKNKESSRNSVLWETSTSTALVSCDGLGGYDWSDQAEEGPNYALMAFSSLSPDSEVSNDSICSKSCLETVELLKSQNDQLLKDLKKSELMVLVPPPYTGNFMPPIPDLSFTGLDKFINEHVVENCKAMSSEEEPKVVRKYDDAPSIEEWVSEAGRGCVSA
ncbi:hypothetical protein Tco_1427647 [Tanacetum coccineum]